MMTVLTTVKERLSSYEDDEKKVEEAATLRELRERSPGPWWGEREAGSASALGPGAPPPPSPAGFICILRSQRQFQKAGAARSLPVGSEPAPSHLLPILFL